MVKAQKPASFSRALPLSVNQPPRTVVKTTDLATLALGEPVSSMSSAKTLARRTAALAAHKSHPSTLGPQWEVRTSSRYRNGASTSPAEIEQAKRAAGFSAVFTEMGRATTTPRVIGIGSGSTIAYVVEAFRQRKVEMIDSV